MDLGPMFAALKALEDDVAAYAVTQNPKDKLRVYQWRPPKLPELPAIWNWIADGSVDVPDTARVDDMIVVRATIGVKPQEVLDGLDRLVRFTDYFRHVVDPALKARPVLPDGSGNATARQARRILTATSFDEFDDVPVMCMDMFIRVQLPEIVA